MYNQSTENDFEEVAEVSVELNENTEISDWQQRHEEIEAQKELIRNRVRKTRSRDSVIIPARPKPTISDPREMNVAVYARVSTKSTNQVSSIENQTLYYTKKVEETPNWNLQEIYSDEGKSGTSTQHRTEFNRMLQDAADKKIDLILCASVSRFARNISDCMTLVRKLKSMNPSHPVGVYFETENIYTLDSDYKTSLSIHAMLADWESANKSSRMILSYDQRIIMQQFPVADLLGYRHTKDGELIIVPEEAKTVRFVFLAAMYGYSYDTIAEILTEKERPTLRGRTDWNASMVRSVLYNERRWGDLEARKTIVIDYVEHKSKKNDGDRVAAYSKGHHEGIVTPEIARAVHMLSGNRGRLNGVPSISVIQRGGLKGFVSINPVFNGIDRETLIAVSRSAYDDNEYKTLERKSRIICGDEHSKNMSTEFSGYYVPYSAYFINRNTPTLTISISSLKFNKKCGEAMDWCRRVELLYHPLLQAIILRECDDSNGFLWSSDNGKLMNSIFARAFCKAVYEEMDWIETYSLRFRGIARKRGDRKIMVFFLDEPQIVPSKEVKIVAEAVKDERKGMPSRYIPIRKSELNLDSGQVGEWRHRRNGKLYFMRKQRDKLIDSLSAQDVAEAGVIVDNPLIGSIPSREQLEDELEKLLASL